MRTQRPIVTNSIVSVSARPMSTALKRTMVYGWGAWQKGGKALKTAEVRGDFENWSLGVGMRHEF